MLRKLDWGVVQRMVLVCCLALGVGCNVETFGAPRAAPSADRPWGFRRLSAAEIEQWRTGLDLKSAFRIGHVTSPDPRVQAYVTQYEGGPCWIGAVACIISEISGGYGGGWSIYAATWSPGGHQMPMQLFSVGSVKRGTSIFGYNVFSLECLSPYTSSCPDADAYSDTCDTQENRVKVASSHAIVWNFVVYTDITSAAAGCMPLSGGGGGDDGGGGCETMLVDVYYWDDVYATWTYDHSQYAQVCD
jgi:hypothetical protein